jgi:tRNA 2-selenouridine synthase
MTPVTAGLALTQLSHYDTIIDARSEGEFAEDHLPGAVNWPVLNNAERVLIGTTYKQVNAFEAKKRGAALVAKNIAHHIEAHLIDKPRDWRPLVYCWRGGNRSGSFAHVLSKIGFKVELLEGGYREYRRALLAEMATLPKEFQYRVICGKTGSGKTRFLQALQDAGAQVLDLEALANHRGSVLGLKPGDVQPSQKLFETRVWQALRQFDRGAPVIVESESKKVGAVQVPEPLISAMRASPCVTLELPLAARVDLLMQEYDFFLTDRVSLHKRLDALIDLRGHATVARWKAWTSDAGNTAAFREFVAESLTLHYDPIYLSSMQRNFDQFEAAKQLVLADGSAATFGSRVGEVLNP